MTRWLVIYLEAPLASFGVEPGNSARGSDDRPTRSALLGLAGAALGLRRDDAAGQSALSASFRTATLDVDVGKPLADFHTFQSLPASERGVATRAEALARRGKLETAISHRGYRMGGRWQAAYRATSDARLSLESLEQAFLRPAFILYLGRKSCALAHPVAASLIEAGSVADAFAQHRNARPEIRWPTGGEVAVDDRADLPPVNQDRQRTRLDDPLHREAWHFAARGEWLFPFPGRIQS
jgi:CRISPR system Cascade subunit CasD